MSGHLTGFYKNPRNILHFFNLLSFQEHYKNQTFLGQNPTEIAFSILFAIASVILECLSTFCQFT